MSHHPTSIHPSLSNMAMGIASLFLAMTQVSHAGTMVYVSNADSQEISVLELDRAQGQLKAVETVAVGGTVMPMAVSPDKRHLYAALRSQPYRVVSFSMDPANGRLKKLAESALAESMANIDTDVKGRWLFSASYGGGRIAINEIGKDGVVGPIRQLIETGPNAHAIHADRQNRFVLATSLGGDEVSVWQLDQEKGRLTALEDSRIKVTAHSGPRHFVWDAAQQHLYLLGELDASLTVYDWDAATGRLREKQRLSTLPPGFSGKPWAADLHFSPDGRHLYTSERSTSTLATFRVDQETGRLQAQGHTPTAKTPRGFAIDPSGHYLIAAGQDSHSVSLHTLDPANGALGTARETPVGKNPNWVEIVDLP